MKTLSAPAIVTIGIGVLLAVVELQAFGELAGGWASLWTPSPFFLIVLYVKIGPLIWVIPTVAFWLWSIHLFRGERYFPIRSFVLMAVAGLAALLWQIQGAWNGYFSVGWAVISGSLFVCAVLFGVLCKRTPTFTFNALAHWLLFAWLASYAFPWLGEPW